MLIGMTTTIVNGARGIGINAGHRTGCCSSATNGTSVPTCPAPCPCACDIEGTGDGVWINTDFNVLNIENATDFNIQKCVDPRWAVSGITGFDRITCLEECPIDNEE